MADADTRSSTARRTRPAPARPAPTPTPAAAPVRQASGPAPAAAPAPDRATIRPHTEGGATAEPHLPPPPGPESQVGPAEAPAAPKTGSSRADAAPVEEAPPPPEPPAPDADAGPEPPVAEEAGADAAPPAGGEAGAGAAPAEAEGEGGAKGGAGPAADVAASVGAALRRSSAPAVATQGQQLAAVAASRASTPEPSAMVADAEAAQTPPEAEAASRAQAATVEAVEGAEAPAADPAAAKASLASGVAASLPTTIEEVDDFREAGDMTASVQQMVRGQTAGVAQTYGAIEETPPPTPPAVPTVPLPAPPPPPPAPRPDLGAGAVGTAPPPDLSALTDASDQALAESGVTDEHLSLVTSGPLAEARAEREGVAATVEAAPAAIEETRTAEQARVEGELSAEEEAAEAEMQAEREAALTGAQGEQQATTSVMEQKRAEVAAHIQGIYDRANETVTAKLDALETESLARFEEGQAAATAAFEQNVADWMGPFKDDRYGGWLGWARWIEDKIWDITELPPVKAMLDREKAAFIATIDALLVEISATIDATIAECQQIVTDAKAEIQAYVDGLGPDLKDAGTAAATALQEKFAALDSAITERRDALQADLAEKREEAIANVEKMIEGMRTGVAAALERLAAFLMDAAAAFIRWALETAGLDPAPFFAQLKKAGDVIGGLVADPLGFLGNLIDAVGAGIRQFGANIKQHLIGGVIEWLTGAMSTVPIQLPQTWDLKGFLFLVLQILGLTWDRIRAKLVKRVGEKPVAIAEKTVDIIRRIVTDGPIALWDMLVEKAAEIKEQALGAIQGWAIFALVKAGIIKLVSMLNPAGAIVQGIITIFNVIMFFVENLQRILAFANSVIDSIANIAAGRIGAAAGFIEQAMARTIPIILGFMGRLIPVSGIGKAVTAAIKKVRAPIDKIVDKAIDTMVGLVKKLVGKAKAGVQKLVDWWKQEKKFKAADGHEHRIYFTGKGGKLMVASKPKGLKELIDEEQAKRAKKGGRDASLAQALRKKQELDMFLASPKVKKGTENVKPEIDTRLGAIRELLIKGKLFGADATPLSNVTFRLSGRRASFVQADPLSALPGNTTGSEPADRGGTTVPGYTHLYSVEPDKGKVGKAWKRGHLLHHELHGPGVPTNLAAITTSMNKRMYDNVEKFAVAKSKEPGAVLKYQATASYLPGTAKKPFLKDFPAQVKVTWWTYDTYPGGKLVPGKGSGYTVSMTEATVPDGAPVTTYRLDDIPRDTWDAIMKARGVSTSIGRRLYSAFGDPPFAAAPSSVLLKAHYEAKAGTDTHFPKTESTYSAHALRDFQTLKSIVNQPVDVGEGKRTMVSNNAI